MKTFGTIVASILGVALVAFAVICAVSGIMHGDGFELFRQWFNIAEEVTETVTPETGEAVATIGRTLKSVLHI